MRSGALPDPSAAVVPSSVWRGEGSPLMSLTLHLSTLMSRSTADRPLIVPQAQFLIFDKMREEGYGVGIEDVRLPVEMAVPSAQVGRIIGKKGQNVRELQRSTGTVIKLPQPPEDGIAPEETVVHMVGPFYSVQSAQRRIRALVSQGAPPPAGRPPRAHLSPSDQPPLPQPPQPLV